jgi:iron complex transport system ATP-binding protein
VASLDIRHQILTLEIAGDFARAGGAVIAVLHDLNLASFYADRILVLSEGRIAADGPPALALAPPVLAGAFGVSLHIGRIRDNRPYVLPLRRAALNT